MIKEINRRNKIFFTYGSRVAGSGQQACTAYECSCIEPQARKRKLEMVPVFKFSRNHQKMLNWVAVNFLQGPCMKIENCRFLFNLAALIFICQHKSALMLGDLSHYSYVLIYGVSFYSRTKGPKVAWSYCSLLYFCNTLASIHGVIYPHMKQS